MTSPYEKRGQFGGNNYWSKPKNVKADTCTCSGRKKITIAIYNGETHVMGSPENVEVVVVNLDKAKDELLREIDDEAFDD